MVAIAQQRLQQRCELLSYGKLSQIAVVGVTRELVGVSLGGAAGAFQAGDNRCLSGYGEEMTCAGGSQGERSRAVCGSHE